MIPFCCCLFSSDSVCGLFWHGFYCVSLLVTQLHLFKQFKKHCGVFLNQLSTDSSFNFIRMFKLRMTFFKGRCWYQHLIHIYWLRQLIMIQDVFYCVCRFTVTACVTTTLKVWTVNSVRISTTICRGDQPRGATPMPARVSPYWSQPVSTGFLWSLPLSVDLCWALLVPSGLYHYVLISAGFYWLPLDFQSFTWSLLVAAGSFWSYG